jgi:hypothetical protein
MPMYAGDEKVPDTFSPALGRQDGGATFKLGQHLNSQANRCIISQLRRIRSSFISPRVAIQLDFHVVGQFDPVAASLSNKPEGNFRVPDIRTESPGATPAQSAFTPRWVVAGLWLEAGLSNPINCG